MEPHPVPKNILTVDFKLFGALTVKQFLKVLGVSLLGLVLFVSPLPKLFSIPLIVIVVILGILSALVPGFQTRLFGFIKALFVSPQYVWKKQQTPPEVLIQKAKEAEEEMQEIKRAAKTGPSLNKLSIDQLIDARNLATGEKEERDELDIGQKSIGFDEYYTEAFGSRTKKTSPIVAGNTSDKPILAMASNPVANKNAVDESIQKLAGSTTATEIADSFTAAKQQIAEQSVVPSMAKASRYIYGIVVDNKEQPVPAATVIMLNNSGQQVEPQTTTGSDGRFSLETTGLVHGSYIIRILHPGFAFYDFRVNYDDKKLPAYKFKAR